MDPSGELHGASITRAHLALQDHHGFSGEGERAISIKDHTFRGRGDDFNVVVGQVKKGVLQNLTMRTAARIVSEPGQRIS